MNQSVNLNIFKIPIALTAVNAGVHDQFSSKKILSVEIILNSIIEYENED